MTAPSARTIQPLVEMPAVPVRVAGLAPEAVEGVLVMHGYERALGHFPGQAACCRSLISIISVDF
jgi:hypothetical protein